MKSPKILITGTAGFIGFHLCKKLMSENVNIVGLDNINDYYDVGLKYGRLAELGFQTQDIHYNEITQSDKYDNLKFIRLDLKEKQKLLEIFEKYNFDYVVNLAAQAGVRYSILNPDAYMESNIIGFYNILECCKIHKIKHLVYASSSSVYGLNEKMPLSTNDNVDHPISLYATSKKSNELLAHCYSHLYNIPTTGLRFFTVYGPWGRPDMAYFLFTKKICEDKPIDIYNYGKMERDFTYIDDIVEGIRRIIKRIPKPDKNWNGKKPNPGTSKAPFKLYNIGNSSPVKLTDFIEVIEKKLGRKVKKNLMPLQPGDIPKTHADISNLENEINYNPSTSIEEGITKFIDWYLEFYGDGSR
ncbi:MAG: NAD-dependent epimerase [Candidatus Cloacimonetes bacterium]|nr:NAD-dependent epimerase [Candidatus Cloacimonadota bacterium]